MSQKGLYDEHLEQYRHPWMGHETIEVVHDTLDGLDARVCPILTLP